MDFFSHRANRGQEDDSSEPDGTSPSPDKPADSDRKNLLLLYKHYRSEGMNLNSKLALELPRDALLDAGKALGMAKRNTFTFANEDDSSFLMDYCIYNCPWGGKLYFEWHLERRHPPAD